MDAQAARSAQTVELLQTLIRNECVNEGTESSGQEIRNADVLEQVVGLPGVDVQRFESAPGRVNLVARLPGRDPDARTLLWNGHTDVVPVTAEGWREDPFGGEIIDGEVWGRGCVDMLNLTSSMAIAFQHLALETARDDSKRPAGDLVFFGCADEESGSRYGARFMAEHHPDAIAADDVMTENGGLHGGGAGDHTVRINVGEKGVAWRRLRVRGVPGHGSQPFRSDNALMTAAKVVQRIGDYRPPARFHELWRSQVDGMGVDDDTRAMLLDPDRIEDFLETVPHPKTASFLHACTHTTFSPNVAVSQTKTNTIPDTVDIDVDVRTLPGEGADEVDAHLRTALGDLYDSVEVTPLMNDRASTSAMHTRLWDAIESATRRRFPDARMDPGLVVGFTDARVHRELGAVAYGTGLLSPHVSAADFGARFHGNDERIDLDSLALTTQFYIDVVDELRRS